MRVFVDWSQTTHEHDGIMIKGMPAFPRYVFFVKVLVIIGKGPGLGPGQGPGPHGPGPICNVKVVKGTVP